LRQLVAEQRHQQLVARDRIIGAEAAASSAQAARDELRQLVDETTRTLEALQLSASQTRTQLMEIRLHRDHLQSEIARIKSSESWRLGHLLLKPWGHLKRLTAH
jgi:hypothetical protein